MRKILVIEDDDIVRKLIVHVLQKEHYQVLTASTGLEGLQRLRADHSIDLILCDIEMPDLDGYGVLEEVRKDEFTYTIPFIFLTAKTEKEDFRTAMTIGADDYLFKPFRNEELLSAINARFHKTTIALEQENKRLERLLAQRTEELRKSNTALENMNAELEKRVAQKTAKLTEANAELDDFAYRISHDLKGPIATIKGLIHVLELEIEAKEKEELVRKLLWQTDKTTQMLGRLASLVEAKRKEIQPTRIVFAEIWQKVMDNLKQRNQLNHEVELKIALPDSATNFYSSAELLIDLLTEIVDNGIRHRAYRRYEQSFVHTNLSIVHEHLAITVEDNGQGIKPDKNGSTEAIFQIFKRNSEETSGSGIGLSYAKAITEKLGGSIEFSTQVGKGSTFYMVIPIFAHLQPSQNEHFKTEA